MFNKIDQLSLENSSNLARNEEGVGVSALDAATLPPLLERVQSHAADHYGQRDGPRMEKGVGEETGGYFAGKSPGLVQVGVAFELAANRILANRPDNRLFFKDAPVFVVELKFDLDDLVFFNAMQTGNRKADAATGNVVDMNDPAAHASLAENFVGAIQAGLFAVGPAKIKQDGKKLLQRQRTETMVPLIGESDRRQNV